MAWKPTQKEIEHIIKCFFPEANFSKEVESDHQDYSRRSEEKTQVSEAPQPPSKTPVVSRKHLSLVYSRSLLDPFKES